MVTRSIFAPIFAPVHRPIVGLDYWQRRAFDVLSLFKSGEQGVWYDPSDLSTLFQDSAGTTPVTASGQPVGLMLDKSGRGNHATQPTAASRPIYRRGGSRGVVNLLTWSEDFGNAVWVKASTTVAANAATSPFGDVTADKITASGASSSVNATFSAVAGQSYTFSVYVKTSSSPATLSIILFNAGFGSTFGVTGFTTSGEWQRVTVSGTSPSTQTAVFSIGGFASFSTGEECFVWGAQLNLGPTALDYQRNDSHLGGVATGASTDLHWLETDGVDDRTASATGGGGTGGFFFSQPVVVTGGTTSTLWSDAGTNTGYRVRINSANKLELSAGNGSAFTVIATAEALSLNKGHLVTAWDDGVNLNVQLDGGAIASIARPVVVAGTAGFTMGKNNTAASDYFAGFAYNGIYRKDLAPTDVERSAVQKYLKSKAGL